MALAFLMALLGQRVETVSVPGQQVSMQPCLVPIQESVVSTDHSAQVAYMSASHKDRIAG